MSVIWIAIITLGDYFLTPFYVLYVLLLFTWKVLFGQIDERKDRSKKLTLSEIEHIINSWLIKHDKQLTVKIIKENNGVTYSIIPSHLASANIELKVGFGIDLWIQINQFTIGLDQDDCDYNYLNESIIHQILSAYEMGHYYIEEWRIGKHLADSRLYFFLEKPNALASSDFNATVKIIRKRLSKKNIISFQALAPSVV